MELFPPLQWSWLNGWIPVLLFFSMYGILLRIFPEDVVDRLYDRSGWTRRQTTLGALGLPFAFASLILIILTPLKIGRPVFWIDLVG